MTDEKSEYQNAESEALGPSSSKVDTMDPSQAVNLEAITSNPISLNAVGQELTAEQKFIILRRMQMDDLKDLDDLPVSASIMLERISELSEERAREILEPALKEFDNDPNFPVEVYDLIKMLLGHDTDTTFNSSAIGKKFEVSEKVDEVKAGSDDESLGYDYFSSVFDYSLQLRTEAALIYFWSPYPEVRAVTDPYDDPSIPCESWRVYLVGIIWVGITSFINQYFAQRYPAITLPSSACQILIYPCGLLLSYLPNLKIPLFKGRHIMLNPGPWSFKEQMLASMMVSITSTPYVEGPIYAMKMSSFYGENWVSWGFQILWGISTQFVGFGLAGIIRKFCIYPSKSLWPSVLPTLAVNRALLVPEKGENIHGWTISRYGYFFIIFAASFVWYWVPGYLFTALSTFNWLTWIKPDNFNLATITGGSSGLGFNPIPTFDWNVINAVVYPLVYPFFNVLNNFAGAIIGFFVIAGVYYTNMYWSAYLPVNSSGTFNNKGESYEISEILNDQGVLDEKKYQEYGPPFYTAANLVLYGSFFASYPFTIFYTITTNWSDIVFAMKSLVKALMDFKRSSSFGYDDAHCRMMRRYKEVPEWVFLLILIISIVLAIVCVEVYPTTTPVWGIFFTIAINFLFLIPFTTLYSLTGYQLTMNVLVELIVGYALPGKPNAHLILKSFGTQTDMQAQDYISNNKMAHYAKISPWSAFRVQVLGTFINLFISLAIINWQITSFEGLCTSDQPQKFTCAADAEIYFSASVIWGVIGPKRIFGGLYPLLRWCFLIGFLLVIPCYFIYRVLPRKYRSYWQPAIIIGGMLNFFAPYNLNYITMGLYISFIFMYYIKNHYLTWWEKYNYITTGGLTSGLAISSVVLFFAVDYHAKTLSWWGNNVNSNGIDGAGDMPLKDISTAPGGYFGPRKGHFP
ncbi:Piso0_000609 [Millerozyma farinosa CBS 7064]|uniref:Piso0_000609 protein n=1 Tax=Pichia sorbitophila (strain ATCC MYA-4447 / BCRC 22081 / CBS 7064 / NBRC 10061 / NRRL Y-12695) TaxID=559304 RepID=G8YR15_PICSO|nr:Piso0_000609 [Millerozyma farinosa CBS 7064]